MIRSIICENGYTEKCYIKKLSSELAIVILPKTGISVKFFFCKKNKKYVSTYNGKILFLNI